MPSLFESYVAKWLSENIAVMDTKYKRDDEPSEEDIQQIVAYAVAMGTSEVHHSRACETK